MRSPFISSWLTVDEVYREHQRKQRELDELLHPPARKQRKPAARREGARLLSQDQIDRGQAQLKLKLNDPKEKNPRRWRLQKSAAEKITLYLGLPLESWQTVEDEIVIPMFEQCGLRKPKK
jgi:hypothetical protein